MSKEVIETLFKFFMSYEEALVDFPINFFIVEVEGGIPPNEFVNDGLVFKLKKMSREKYGFEYTENVYIFNNKKEN